MNYKDTLSNLEDRINALLADDNVDDYSKVFIKDIADSIVELKKDASDCLIDSLLSFKEKTFCNRNFSDCLDCSNVSECKMIQHVCDLICKHKNFS